MAIRMMTGERRYGTSCRWLARVNASCSNSSGQTLDCLCFRIELQLCGYVDSAVERPVHGALHLEGVVRPLCRLDLVCGHAFQREDDVDPTEQQNALVHFHFSMSHRRQVACARRDPARLQRASQGAKQSTAGGGNHIVDRRGVRIGHVPLNAIVASNRTVSAETNWFTFGGHLGKPQRTLHARQRD